jgi:hypothetical protein
MHHGRPFAPLDEGQRLWLPSKRRMGRGDYFDGYRHGVSISSLLLEQEGAIELWGAQTCTTLIDVATRAGRWALDDFLVNSERRRGFVDGFVTATMASGGHLRIVA